MQKVNEFQALSPKVKEDILTANNHLLTALKYYLSAEFSELLPSDIEEARHLIIAALKHLPINNAHEIQAYC